MWPEFRPDLRWGQRLYSELKVLDLKTGRPARNWPQAALRSRRAHA
ncbi:MAG: hypothetical protein WKG07_25780 [Hymenobacter sp.]